jgi:beta-lactamase regulating signal transducer with metallopeptidase domain
MATEVLLALIRANVAVSAAIAAVLLLRAQARGLFGPQVAYALWLAVPAALLGALFNASDSAGPTGAATGVARVWLARPSHAEGLLTLWLIGVGVALALVIWSQLRFLAAARAGRAGPAITGIVHARLVVPADFAERFTPEERRLVRAHERAHMDRLDVRANAWAVLIQCLGWFNPALHLAARAMRLDQELACDATVIARLPRERRRYAETLLKTGLVQVGLPLGCHWAARGAHPLEARIGMLTRPTPPPARRDAGKAALVALAIAALCAAWAVQPPQPPWLAMLVTAPMAFLLNMG